MLLTFGCVTTRGVERLLNCTCFGCCTGSRGGATLVTFGSVICCCKFVLGCCTWVTFGTCVIFGCCTFVRGWTTFCTCGVTGLMLTLFCTCTFGVVVTAFTCGVVVKRSDWDATCLPVPFWSALAAASSCCCRDWARLRSRAASACWATCCVAVTRCSCTLWWAVWWIGLTTRTVLLTPVLFSSAVCCWNVNGGACTR